MWYLNKSQHYWRNMKKTLILAALSLLASTAIAQMPTVESAPLIKVDRSPDPKIAILVVVYPPAAYQCGPGYDLYVQRIRPKESKDPETAFKGYFWISPPIPNQPNTGLVTSREGNEVTGACFKTK